MTASTPAPAPKATGRSANRAARDETAHRVEGHITRSTFPLPDVTWPYTAEFWAAAARHELRIPVCATCGRYRWYPKATCLYCDGEPYTWEEVSGRGTLFSWVVVAHPFLPQFADMVPYVPALVALEEDPAVRVPTRMVDCEPGDLAFDMPVTVTFREISFTGVDGAVTAPLFVPA